MTDQNEADSVSAFATDLRDLRMAAGNPTLAALSTTTSISKSVLSEAFRGKRLPTENTVSLLVEALHGDRTGWLTRRRVLRLSPEDGDSGTIPQPQTARSAPSRTGSLSRTLLTVAASVIATSVVWATLVLPAVSSASDAADDSAAALEAAPETPTAAASPAPTQAEDSTEYEPYADGVDPMLTECREDAVLAGSEQRLGGDVQIQMMYSTSCMAAWGRATRYDNKSAGNEISIRVYPIAAPESSRAQERTSPEVQSVYSPMLIEPDVEASVCGIASMTVDGETIDLGPPLCI